MAITVKFNEASAKNFGKGYEVLDDGLTCDRFETDAKAQAYAEELRKENDEQGVVEDVVEDATYRLMERLRTDRMTARKKLLEYLQL